MNILEAKEIGNQIRNDENDPDASWINVLQSKHYYAEVEQRVVRQLIQALIYENILSYEYLDGAASNSACAFLLEGKTPDGQIVRYHCPGRFKDSFGLAKLDKGPIVRLSGDSEPRPTSLQDVFAEIVRQIPHAEHLTAFMNELEQTLLKDLRRKASPGPFGCLRRSAAMTSWKATSWMRISIIPATSPASVLP